MPDTPSKTWQAIFYRLPSEVADGLLAALGESVSARRVDAPVEALSAIRAEALDLLLLAPDALPSLSHAVGQHKAEIILERIGQGVCIVGRNGNMVYANPKLLAQPPAAIDAVRRACAELLAEYLQDAHRGEAHRTRRRIIAVGDMSFDLTASLLPASGSEPAQLVGLVWDVTGTRRLQEKINAIDAAGSELCKLDADAPARMDVGERLRYLEDNIIRYSRELMHFTHFTVRVLDTRANRLETVLAGGFSEEAKSLDIYATPEGNGISGYVAATGRSYICPDVSKDPRYLPGLEGARSSLTVPLKLHDQVVGVLNVESDEIAAFSEDDRQFAEIFGRYIAVALSILKLLATERHAVVGELASDVHRELAAPLNDIITEATNAMEDYIGDDALRRRLHAIIDNVDRVKRTLHAVTHPQGVSGLTPTEIDRDPIIDGKRVLVAEDEEIIRETVADVLEKKGAITVMARDGEEALLMLRAQHFDLVLSDIKMPYKNGYEVFAAAKQASADCPVILITGFGYDPDHQIVRASKEGLSGVLFKPFKVDTLLEEVRKALAPVKP